MARQLFYGKLSPFTPIGNGSNSYIRVRFDAATDSTTLTNVTDVSGFLNIDFVRVGQTLVESSAFPSGTVITAVDTSENTITVTDLPTTAESQGLGRISPAPGDYYIASASITDPQGLINFNDITGSADTDYVTDSIIYGVLGQAADSSQNIITGRFHKYTISEVFYRNPVGNEGSIYIEWGEKDTEASSGDELYQSNQATAIVGLSISESLSPIFTRNLTGIQDLNVGQETAGYQIEVQDFLDDLSVSDIFYTGSLVLGNAGNLNFAGSGVEVEKSGSDGVLINITGGAGGTSGSSGSSGTSGIDGSSGSSGTSGADGSSGSSGTSGSSGSSGTSGADGSSGSSGTSGIDGSSGSSGTSGADGSSGSSGTSGADGSSGSSGTSGSSGSSGTSGADGSSGSSGTSGADGSSGSSGTSGADGSSGSSGSSGTSGADGSSGSSGTSGADGSSGSSGTSGADGSSGSSGTSGDDGSSGSSGTSGSSGSSGTSGADGSSGSSGTSGADGSSGSSGSSGTSGVDGSSGSSGTSGVDGSSGSSGTSGADGSSGSSGTSGSSGSSGTSGTSGADGSSGSSGTSGSSGSSGTSGADGSSGSSGTSGSSGSSGTSGVADILNNADHRLTTANGISGELQAEADFTFDPTDTDRPILTLGEVNKVESKFVSFGRTIISGSDSSSTTRGLEFQNISGSTYNSYVRHNAEMELELSSSVAINIAGIVNRGVSSSGGSLTTTLTYKGTIGTSAQVDVLSAANLSMDSTDYIGLVADYAIETSIGARRFGTVKVTFNNTTSTNSDISTLDLGSSTSAVSFSTTGDPLELFVVNSDATNTVDIAMSFKLISVP